VLVLEQVVVLMAVLIGRLLGRSLMSRSMLSTTACANLSSRCRITRTPVDLE